MNATRTAAALIAAATATTAAAQVVTIGFEAELVSSNDENNIFLFESDATVTGEFNYDLNAQDLFPPFEDFPDVPGIFETGALNANISQGLQTFGSPETAAFLFNDQDFGQGVISDSIQFNANVPFEFPEEIVFVTLNVALAGEADWFETQATLPPSDTIGLENATSAQFVVTLQVPTGFPDLSDPTDNNNNGTPDVLEDLDGNGIIDGFENVVNVTSEAVFNITALTVNGEVFKRFDGDIDITLPADLNNDNTVNGEDLFLVLGNFGTNNPEADTNDDNIVNGADLFEVLGSFGQSI